MKHFPLILLLALLLLSAGHLAQARGDVTPTPVVATPAATVVFGDVTPTVTGTPHTAPPPAPPADPAATRTPPVRVYLPLVVLGHRPPAEATRAP